MVPWREWPGLPWRAGLGGHAEIHLDVLSFFVREPVCGNWRNSNASRIGGGPLNGNVEYRTYWKLWDRPSESDGGSHDRKLASLPTTRDWRN